MDSEEYSLVSIKALQTFGSLKGLTFPSPFPSVVRARSLPSTLISVSDSSPALPNPPARLPLEELSYCG